jgi:hypothetical protein
MIRSVSFANFGVKSDSDFCASGGGRQGGGDRFYPCPSQVMNAPIPSRAAARLSAHPLAGHSRRVSPVTAVGTATSSTMLPSETTQRRPHAHVGGV